MPGGSSKSLMIVNVYPNKSNLAETVSSLNFSARARNSTLSLGSRDTIKKWRDVVCFSKSLFPSLNVLWITSVYLRDHSHLFLLKWNLTSLLVFCSITVSSRNDLMPTVPMNHVDLIFNNPVLKSFESSHTGNYMLCCTRFSC